MSVEVKSIDLPNDPAMRKKIKDAIELINDHQIQVDSHREGISEIVKEISKESNVPGSTIRRWAKWRLKGNRDEEVGKISDEDGAFDILFSPNTDKQV